MKINYYYPKKSLLILILYVILPSIVLHQLNAADDLFFSEYIEGSSNNKAIEIYNGTDIAVDLAQYKLEIYFNGNSSAGSNISLTGTLSNGDVYVIAHSSANDAIKAAADQLSSTLSFNGNDAVILKHNSIIIDAIGQIGFDPGKEWGTAGITTLDHSLLRKTGIIHGDNNPTDVFDPAEQWDGYPKDTFDYLGYYLSGGPTVSPTLTPEITPSPTSTPDITATPVPTESPEITPTPDIASLYHYFGQLHSHTNYSDGNGTPDEAYTWARDMGGADFFAVTDHSNWFDNEFDWTKSTEWANLKLVADRYNVNGRFTAIAGFEMTWSGSTGGWGHINTFNTDWFVSRNDSTFTLQNYYNKLKQFPSSISQLNHPGPTFGDFNDFGYYDPEIDKVITLIEVGNGEGPVHGNGYFPSYDEYTRALDKGWHVAPANNQDNHLANWVSANEARTVVLAPNLTREDIYDALRNRRVYASEDRNLKLFYTVNNAIMGSQINEAPTVDIQVKAEDPDSTDIIKQIEIIANGGTIAAKKNFDANTAEWSIQLPAHYSYYYAKITQTDGDIAVTAPVWIGMNILTGIARLETSGSPVLAGSPVKITATLFNNTRETLTDVKVDFFSGRINPENQIGQANIISLPPGQTVPAVVEYAYQTAGEYLVYARMILTLEGISRTFTAELRIDAYNPEDIINVVIDTGHQNQYVSGDYKDKITGLKKLLAGKKMFITESGGLITADLLKDVRILIITDPQSTENAKYQLAPSVFTDEETTVIKNFIDAGGSLIITSRADYQDAVPAEYQNSRQGNKILEAIGTGLRFNDDEVIDNTQNNGASYRLMFNQFISTKFHLTDGIPEGSLYSVYSGCSVILKPDTDQSKIDFLVKGHVTTETTDADNQNDKNPVAQGDVMVIGAELLPGGGKVVAAGSTFFSDFEITGDNINANQKILENILDWLAVEPAGLKPVCEVRIDQDMDGKPDMEGKRIAVEGRITAESQSVSHNGMITNNAFFDVIYLQDDTGGITVFGVSKTSLPLGTKVRITGIVGQYNGDTQIRITNELNDLVILDDPLLPIPPVVLSSSKSMSRQQEGLLVKITGTVVRLANNRLYLNDGSGEARVYLDGYIGDGTANQAMLGKWDPLIGLGDLVSAVGLVSRDTEGTRIRVRNSAEIQLIQSVLPGIHADISPAPNQYDWFHTDVTVHFAADDPFQLLESITPDIILTAEGIGQTVIGTAINRGGKIGTVIVSNINIDKTAPIITVEFASKYYAGESLLLAYSAVDSLSGIDYVRAVYKGKDYANGDFILLDTPGIQTIDFIAQDRAGNLTVISKTFCIAVKAVMSIIPDHFRLSNHQPNWTVLITVQFPRQYRYHQIILNTIRLNDAIIPVKSINLDCLRWFNRKSKSGLTNSVLLQFDWKQIKEIMKSGKQNIKISGHTDSFEFDAAGKLWILFSKYK